MRRKYNKRKKHVPQTSCPWFLFRETRPVSQVKKFSNQAEYDLKNPAYCRCAYSLARLCMTQARSTSKDRIAGLPTPHCLFLSLLINAFNALMNVFLHNTFWPLAMFTTKQLRTLTVKHLPMTNVHASTAIITVVTRATSAFL